MDRCGEGTVCGVPQLIMSISTVKSEKRGALEASGQRGGCEITGWEIGREINLGNSGIVAKGISSPLEVCSHEFKIRPPV